MIKKILTFWNDFWFAPIDLLNISVFRVLYGAGAVVFYMNRQLDFKFLYSEQGIFPYAVLEKVFPDAYHSPVRWASLLAHESTAYLLHWVFVGLILALTLGLLNRFFKLVMLTLYLAFFFRNISVLYGPDMISSCWLFYLCLIPTNAYFSPFSRKISNKQSDLLGSVGIKLMLVHFCVIYAYSGFEKMKGQTWWRGDAIWNVLGNGQMVSWDFSFLHHIPWAVPILTFTTVLWECYFPLLLLYRPLRYPSLIFGLILHLMIGILLNIPFFSYFMICVYVLLIDRDDLAKLLQRGRISVTPLTPSLRES